MNTRNLHATRQDSGPTIRYRLGWWLGAKWRKVLDWLKGLTGFRIGSRAVWRERRFRRGARVVACGAALFVFGLGVLAAQASGGTLTASEHPLTELLERSAWPVLSALAMGFIVYGRMSIRVERLERDLAGKANQEAVDLHHAGLDARITELKADLREDMAALRENVTTLISEMPVQLAAQMGSKRR